MNEKLKYSIAFYKKGGDMKKIQCVLSLLFSILLFQCSSPDFVAEAEKAMENANYGEAIKLWEKAKQQED